MGIIKKQRGGNSLFCITNNYIMSQNKEILKQIFTFKNIALGILFNALSLTFMYASLHFLLYLRYDLGWI